MAKNTVNTKLREEIKELEEKVAYEQKLTAVAWKEEKTQRERADLYRSLNENERQHSEEKIVFMQESVAWFRALLEKMVVDPEVLRIELKRMQIESKEARKHERHTEELEQRRLKRYERNQAMAMKNSGQDNMKMVNVKSAILERPVQGLDKLGRF